MLQVDSTSRRWFEMRMLNTVLVATVLMAAMVGGAVPALAQEATASVPEERLEYLCSRIPLVEARIAAVKERIHGDASTWGSLAWLEVKAGQAEDRGLDDLAERLRLRIDVLVELDDLLDARSARLDALDAKCRELGALS